MNFVQYEYKLIKNKMMLHLHELNELIILNFHNMRNSSKSKINIWTIMY